MYQALQAIPGKLRTIQTYRHQKLCVELPLRGGGSDEKNLRPALYASPSACEYCSFSFNVLSSISTTLLFYIMDAKSKTNTHLLQLPVKLFWGSARSLCN